MSRESVRNGCSTISCRLMVFFGAGVLWIERLFYITEKNGDNGSKGTLWRETPSGITGLGAEVLAVDDCSLKIPERKFFCENRIHGVFFGNIFFVPRLPQFMPYSFQILRHIVVPGSNSGTEAVYITSYFSWYSLVPAWYLTGPYQFVIYPVTSNSTLCNVTNWQYC
jgi:hypothetical protein